ncbi:hypothetical protein D187_005761 [Cystobacter fuscus DSM 2262]|uniref:Serine protease n=1 Tax=Cystobacter fuscus (strain ATCC 25194 / DSM 2262 / NBRC 100088 / M29) TaxID=1242864 RepID=S9PG47_CYSF2|nr:serine protease [Cystobacter fuscus]EPX63355.1 hypothetical protein D187_005761 [Cystobacter fuscus DSM 2262]
MTRLLPLVLALVSAGALAAEKPTRADLQKTLALYERSVVKVRGGRGAGPGIIVGAEGQVLTSVRHVDLEAARVEFAGQSLPATVVLANAMLKVAVVAAPTGNYPAVPVQVSAASPAGQWLIGVVPGKGRRQDTPTAGLAREAPEPFIDVDVALPPGSPLFDTRGRLVAVSVQRKGRGCRALPLDAVKQQLVTRVATP